MHKDFFLQVDILFVLLTLQIVNHLDDEQNLLAEFNCTLSRENSVLGPVLKVQVIFFN